MACIVVYLHVYSIHFKNFEMNNALLKRREDNEGQADLAHLKKHLTCIEKIIAMPIIPLFTTTSIECAACMYIHYS